MRAVYKMSNNMSTKEKAYSILEQLTENELQGFITLFSRSYPPKTDDLASRCAAFERLEKLCRHIPEL